LQLKYKRVRIVQVFDKRFFKICDIKEKEIGIVKKKFLYTHFDGKQWRILQLAADLSTVKCFKIE
jgi:hypothetical protein